MSDAGMNAQIEAAKAYEGLFVPALFGQWVPGTAAQVGVQPGERILDVGCGTGILTRTVATQAGPEGHVVGLDPSPGMLAVAGELAPGIDWREGVAEAIPYPDRSFDAVVSQFGLMFFADRRQGLREMLRVLSPAGRVGVVVWDSLDRNPGYATEAALLERIAGASAAEAVRAPFSLGDRDELVGLFADAGADAVEVTASPGTARFPSIEVMVEAELRGWLPVMGVHLEERTIAAVLREAADALAPFRTPDGAVEFELSALRVTATKPGQD